MMLCSDQFPNEASRIAWVLSLMRTDRAYRFSQRALAYMVDNSRWEWNTFEEFSKEFAQEFFTPEEEIDALTRLETSAYHQGRRTIDDYVDDFVELMTRSRFSDMRSAVVKFRKGLEPSFAHTLAESLHPPANDDLKGWVAQAKQLDRSRRMHQQTTAILKTTSTAPAKAEAPRAHPLRFGSVPAAPAAVNPPVAPKLPVPPAPRPLPPGIPMDVDATRSQAARTARCFRCGQTGHLRSDCPQRYDVRYLDVEELQNALVNALDAKESMDRQEEVQTAVHRTEEDFASDSE
jgi:hypothetical protein